MLMKNNSKTQLRREDTLNVPGDSKSGQLADLYPLKSKNLPASHSRAMFA